MGLHNAYRDRGFTVLAVMVWDEETPGQVKAFAQREKIPYPILVQGSSAGTDWGVRLLPENYLLDCKGEVAGRFSDLTPRTLPELRRRIEMLVAKPQEEKGSGDQGIEGSR